MKKIIILICSLFLVSGCASTGNKVLKNETSSAVAAKITKGVTTKEQVRGMYGDPMTTSFTDSGKEIWKYEFVKTHAKATNFIPLVSMFNSGAKGTKKELVIMFDDNGIVKNYSMSSSKVDTDTSLFQ